MGEPVKVGFPFLYDQCDRFQVLAEDMVEETGGMLRHAMDDLEDSPR
jgi:hypothetical protein